MEIHQLRYFVAVAGESSFSQAAQREHVSQPSLSQQIHKLEEELNQQLFDRLPRSVVLTAAGRCLLPYARVVLTAIADGGRAVTALVRTEDRTRALRAGFQLHVPKPVDSAELIAVVQNLADLRSQES